MFLSKINYPENTGSLKKCTFDCEKWHKHLFMSFFFRTFAPVFEKLHLNSDI